jgi:hypothetical protein
MVSTLGPGAPPYGLEPPGGASTIGLDPGFSGISFSKLLCRSIHSLIVSDVFPFGIFLKAIVRFGLALQNDLRKVIVDLGAARLSF